MDRYTRTIEIKELEMLELEREKAILEMADEKAIKLIAECEASLLAVSEENEMLKETKPKVKAKIEISQDAIINVAYIPLMITCLGAYFSSKVLKIPFSIDDIMPIAGFMTSISGAAYLFETRKERRMARVLRQVEANENQERTITKNEDRALELTYAVDAYSMQRDDIAKKMDTANEKIKLNKIIVDELRRVRTIEASKINLEIHQSKEDAHKKVLTR